MDSLPKSYALYSNEIFGSPDKTHDPSHVSSEHNESQVSLSDLYCKMPSEPECGFALSNDKVVSANSLFDSYFNVISKEDSSAVCSSPLLHDQKCTPINNTSTDVSDMSGMLSYSECDGSRVSLSDLYFNMTSESECDFKLPDSDKGLTDSLLDCYSVFKAKQGNNDVDCVRNHSEVQNVSLAELNRNVEGTNESESNNLHNIDLSVAVKAERHVTDSYATEFSIEAEKQYNVSSTCQKNHLREDSGSDVEIRTKRSFFGETLKFRSTSSSTGIQETNVETKTGIISLAETLKTKVTHPIDGAEEYKNTIKSKKSLLAKVLICKSKTPESRNIPKPLQIWKEMYSPQNHTSLYFKNHNLLTHRGSSSAEDKSDAQIVEHEEEVPLFAGISGRMVISSGGIQILGNRENAVIFPGVPERATNHTKPGKKFFTPSHT